MIFIDLKKLPVADLPIAAFKDHLRFGTGFDDNQAQDAMLEHCLRAALTLIEKRIGKSILQRTFFLSLVKWGAPDRHVLPTAPVQSIVSVTLVAHGGSKSITNNKEYSMQQDTHYPVLVGKPDLPMIATGGSVEMVFIAGYAAKWNDLPADLQQAVFVLAAHFYDHRGGSDDGNGIKIIRFVDALLHAYRALHIGRAKYV